MQEEETLAEAAAFKDIGPEETEERQECCCNSVLAESLFTSHLLGSAGLAEIYKLIVPVGLACKQLSGLVVFVK